MSGRDVVLAVEGIGLCVSGSELLSASFWPLSPFIAKVGQKLIFEESASESIEMLKAFLAPRRLSLKPAV